MLYCILYHVLNPIRQCTCINSYVPGMVRTYPFCQWYHDIKVYTFLRLYIDVHTYAKKYIQVYTGIYNLGSRYTSIVQVPKIVQLGISHYILYLVQVVGFPDLAVTRMWLRLLVTVTAGVTVARPGPAGPTGTN